jgi:hypothetical protein
MGGPSSRRSPIPPPPSHDQSTAIPQRHHPFALEKDRPFGVCVLPPSTLQSDQSLSRAPSEPSPLPERPGFSLAAADGPGPSGPGIDNTSIKYAEGYEGRSQTPRSFRVPRKLPATLQRRRPRTDPRETRTRGDRGLRAFTAPRLTCVADQRTDRAGAYFRAFRSAVALESSTKDVPFDGCARPKWRVASV